jgi:hypothetical protein
MATVTASYNWVSGETVTPAKLNTTAAPTVVVADNEVTTSKILDANVTTAKIADANVTAAKLATSAVETAKIADDAVTNDKLSLSANAGEIKKALNADNSPPIYACRAWVNFDGTRDSTGASNTSNTNRFIRANGNVGSVSKTGTGAYTINFTTAMPSSDYCVQITTQNETSGAGLTRLVSYSTSAFSFIATDAGGTATNSVPHLNVSIFA